MAAPPKPAVRDKAKSQKPHPRQGTVEPGDHVYVHHPEHGPTAVKVLAHGRDGFTGEDEMGKRHAIGWDRMLGHKSRIAMEMKVIDQGQEGAIVEDGRGRRRYLAGDPGEGAGAAPAPKAEEKPKAGDPLLDRMEMLGKALAGGGRVIFLKAAGANRAGLAVRPATSRAGERGRKEKPAAPDRAEQPPARPGDATTEDSSKKPDLKHGDVVAFRHGDVQGQGTIVGSGRDGVTLRSEDGQTLQVRHDALTGKAPAGEAEGAEDGEKDEDGGEAEPKKKPPAKPKAGLGRRLLTMFRRR